jgi:hypothetical protein
MRLLLFPPQFMQRSQVFHRQLDEIAVAVDPVVASQAAIKVPLSVIDLYERASALFAFFGHSVGALLF